MIDFLIISTRSTKRGVIEIYPKFRLYPKSKDLMIRGGDFYAIWVEERGLWSTDEQDALQLIDRELDRYAEENRGYFDGDVRVLHMWDSESGMIDSWHKYCQKQTRDSFHMLDEKLIFSNTETNKKDYASKRLDYPLEEGDLTAYNKLMSTLYSEEDINLLFYTVPLERVNPLYSISYRNYLTDIIRCLMPKLWVPPATLLRWRHLKPIRSWRFNTTATYQESKIIRD